MVSNLVCDNYDGIDIMCSLAVRVYFRNLGDCTRTYLGDVETPVSLAAPVNRGYAQIRIALLLEEMHDAGSETIIDRKP
jgi:hypothetical protein